MPIIRIMLVLWALCAPIGGAVAQNVPSTPHSCRLAISDWNTWDGWIAYSTRNATVNPRELAAGLHDCVVRQYGERMSPALRNIYRTPESLRDFLRRQHEVFSYITPITAINFLNMIGTRDGVTGFVLPTERSVVRPIEPAVSPRSVFAPRTPTTAPPAAAAPVTQEQFRMLMERLERQEQELERLRNSGAARDQESTLERTLETVTASLGALMRTQEELARASGRHYEELVATAMRQQATLDTALADLRRLEAEPRQITTIATTTIQQVPDWLLYGGGAGVALGLILVLWCSYNTKDTKRAHGRIDVVRRGVADLREETDRLHRRLTVHERSPRFDPSLVSASAIAALRDGQEIIVPVTLASGVSVPVTVKREELALTISPLRREPGGEVGVQRYTLNSSVASVIAKAGREDRIGETVVAPSATHQKDAA